MLSITAIIVLYHRAAEQSAALQSLLGLSRRHEGEDVRLHILVYDNSPSPDSAPQQSDPLLRYHAAASNMGLAPAYNMALAAAAERNDEWLLLLDQDTTLTESYWSELTDAARHLRNDASIAAVVPKLQWQGVIYSPESHLFDQLRAQFPHRSHAVAAENHGAQPRRVAAYNSGALLRMTALQSIGGFPQDFWLDYLDHAVFHLLAERGFRVYVLKSTLEHPLAHTDPDAVPLWRERNVLAAQTLMVKRFGGFAERMLYRLYLLRMGRQSIRERTDPRAGMEKLLQALLLRTRPVSLGRRAA